MALVMKEDISANLLHVGFLSAIGIVFEPNSVLHLIEEFLRALLHERKKNV
jgi:hypothetical protein